MISIVADARACCGRFSPHYAVEFFLLDPRRAFLALGSVVLAVTGAEALYADMGHFGRKPIGMSWLFFVLPGADAQLYGPGRAADPRRASRRSKARSTCSRPNSLQLPLVILATLAAVIASQAVISGAFSVTQQAIQLGFMPRLRIEHTSASTAGQIYIPLDQLGADDDGDPAGAVLPHLVEPRRGLWHRGDRRDVDRHLPARGRAVPRCGTGRSRRRSPLLALFFLVDGAYLAANLTKIPDGGWFPLLVGFIVFTLLTTWAKGRQLMIDAAARGGDADQGVHQVRRQLGEPRARHRGVHDLDAPTACRTRCSTISSTTRCCTSASSC